MSPRNTIRVQCIQLIPTRMIIQCRHKLAPRVLALIASSRLATSRRNRDVKHGLDFFILNFLSLSPRRILILNRCVNKKESDTINSIIRTLRLDSFYRVRASFPPPSLSLSLSLRRLCERAAIF